MSDYTPAEQDEVQADLEALYQAGRVALPARADGLADVARQMSDVILKVNSCSAQMGDPAPVQDALRLAIDSQAGVARSVGTLNNIARGVVAVADDFVARDEFARAVFNGLSSDLTSGPVGQADVPYVPDEDNVLEAGDGSGYQANPDVRTPADELAERDRRLEDEQSDVAFPED